MKKILSLEIILLLLAIVYLASSVARYFGYAPHWTLMLTAAIAALLLYARPKEVFLALLFFTTIVLTTAQFSDTFMQGAAMLLDVLLADFFAWESIYEFPGPLTTLVLSVLIVFILTYIQLFLVKKGYANIFLILLGFAVYLGLWLQLYPQTEKELLIFLAFSFPTFALFSLRAKMNAPNFSYKLALLALGVLSALIVTFLPYQNPLYYEEVFVFARTHLPSLQNLQREERGTLGRGTWSSGAQSQVGYSSSGELGGSLSDSTWPVIELEIIEGSLPRALYLRGHASDFYSGHSWNTSDLGTADNLVSAFQHVEVYENQIEMRVAYLQSEQDIFGLFPTTAIHFSGNDHTREYWVDSLGNIRIEGGAFKGEYLLSGKVITGIDRLDWEPRADLQKKEMSHLLPFLQLPEHLPQRVIELAEEITSGAQTDLGKVKRIEEYLRQFPYSIHMPPHPPGEDFVDYFLFELQEGYCTYYASAMAILLRVQGIPTRYIVGYRVSSDSQHPIILVQENHAHAWVEVFLDGYGWVAFEPTQPFEILDAFENDGSAGIQDGQQDEEPADEFGGLEGQWTSEHTEELNQDEFTTVLGESREGEEEIQPYVNDPEKAFPQVIWAFLLAGASFFAVSFTIYHDLTHIKGPVDLYHKVVKLKSAFHIPPEPGETPSQIVAQLQDELPQIKKDLELMKHFYHLSCYSRGKFSIEQPFDKNGFNFLPLKAALLYRKKLGSLRFIKGLLGIVQQKLFAHLTGRRYYN